MLIPLTEEQRQQYPHMKAMVKGLSDMQAAIDATVLKQGVFTLTFHPDRWIRSDQPAASIREAAAAAGGHATRFRDRNRDDVFHPLPDGLLSLQQRLKASFDPAGILNPGRLYDGL